MKKLFKLLVPSILLASTVVLAGTEKEQSSTLSNLEITQNQDKKDDLSTLSNTSYYPTGEVKEVEEYVDDMAKVTTYYKTGKKSKSTLYHKNDKVKAMRSQSKKNGHFSFFFAPVNLTTVWQTETKYYSTGEVKEVINSVEETATLYYKNGQIYATLSAPKQGVGGKLTIYYESGELLVKVNLPGKKVPNRIGSVKLYYKTGIIENIEMNMVYIDKLLENKFITKQQYSKIAYSIWTESLALSSTNKRLLMGLAKEGETTPEITTIYYISPPQKTTALDDFNFVKAQQAKLPLIKQNESRIFFSITEKGLTVTRTYGDGRQNTTGTYDK